MGQAQDSIPMNARDFVQHEALRLQQNKKRDWNKVPGYVLLQRDRTTGEVELLWASDHICGGKLYEEGRIMPEEQEQIISMAKENHSSDQIVRCVIDIQD
jgi:hypothetical protein